MNRQILMKHKAIGKGRVVQAKKTIQEMNPDVEIEIVDERITDECREPASDGPDRAFRPAQLRRAEGLNKACIDKGIPMVEAAMNGMEGYLFNVLPGVSPASIASILRTILMAGNGIPGPGRGIGNAGVHDGTGSDQAADGVREAPAFGDAGVQYDGYGFQKGKDSPG